MANYVYIKMSVRGSFVEFDTPILPEYNADDLGTTYEDYLNNLWVPLSAEQIAFREENPTASVYEVWNMQLTPPHVRTLEEAKQEMIDQINSYDNSDEVNGFTINGSMVAWLTVPERTNYRNSIDSAKLLGIETLSLYINGMPLQISTVMAEQMLAQIQLYADSCYIVTMQHKSAVEALDTIEEVDNYNYRDSYPSRLNFNLVADE